MVFLVLNLFIDYIHVSNTVFHERQVYYMYITIAFFSLSYLIIIKCEDFGNENIHLKKCKKLYFLIIYLYLNYWFYNCIVHVVTHVDHKQRSEILTRFFVLERLLFMNFSAHPLRYKGDRTATCTLCRERKSRNTTNSNQKQCAKAMILRNQQTRGNFNTK